MITVTPVAQTGYRVVITIAGLSSEVPSVDVLTLYRDDVETRSPVRGVVDVVPAGDAIVAVDFEAPLGRPVFYELEVTRADGSVGEYVAGPVTLEATLPVVSDPVTGEHVEVTVHEWPERISTNRGTVVEVAGRTDPVVVSDVMGAPSSSPVLRTLTRAQVLGLRSVLADGAVVLLRAPCPGVEDAYLVVQQHAEQRIRNDATDDRRRHILAAVHAAPPALEIAAQGDTLADLNAAVPTTLLAISTTFSTLLEIAAADLSEL